MRRGYPATVNEVLCQMKYRRGVVRAVRAFAATKPWRGTVDERMGKFTGLHELLCQIYGKTTTLSFDASVESHPNAHSGASSYSPATDTITLCGKLSVVTYLHEFAHALGRDERGACRWSLNLYRRVWPRQFARMRHVGHTVVAE